MKITNIKRKESLTYDRAYCVEDAPKNDNGDRFCEYFSEETEAIREAEKAWRHLTESEKKRRSVSVLVYMRDEVECWSDEEDAYAWFEDICNGGADIVARFEYGLHQKHD